SRRWLAELPSSRRVAARAKKSPARQPCSSIRSTSPGLRRASRRRSRKVEAAASCARRASPGRRPCGAPARSTRRPYERRLDGAHHRRRLDGAGNERGGAGLAGAGARRRAEPSALPTPGAGMSDPLVVIDADVLGRRRTGDETYIENLLRALPAVGGGLRFAAITRRPELVPDG